MAKQLPGAVSASCLHVVPGDSVSLHTYASSSESHSAFVLWVWRNTLGCLPATYLYHIFWYLPPFSLDTMTTYVGPSSLGSFALRNIPPSSEGSYASQLQAPQQTDLRRYPQRPTEMSWSGPWKCHAFSVTGGKVEVPSAKCLESGGIKACPSWICLQPPLPAVHLHVLFWSLSWLGGNTTSNHTLRAGTFQKVAELTNIQ